MEPCYFAMEYVCSALNVKHCDGCRFRKTEKQFFDDKKRAEKMLEERGLEPHMKGKIMTVRKRRERNEFNQVKTGVVEK